MHLRNRFQTSSLTAKSIPGLRPISSRTVRNRIREHNIGPRRPQSVQLCFLDTVQLGWRGVARFPFGIGHWPIICIYDGKSFDIAVRLTHATYASYTWSSILQFIHNLFWLKLKWNARSKLFYCIIYRFSMLRWSSRTLTKLKSQSQKRFHERKYQYLKYENKNHTGPDM